MFPNLSQYSYVLPDLRGHFLIVLYLPVSFHWFEPVDSLNLARYHPIYPQPAQCALYSPCSDHPGYIQSCVHLIDYPDYIRASTGISRCLDLRQAQRAIVEAWLRTGSVWKRVDKTEMGSVLR